MKYVIIIPDGCADEPQEELDGQTPLAAANTPAMDAIAKAGVVGRANHVPSHLTPGSAVANMSLLGYDPNIHFTGRAPLEAAAQGIELGPEDWAIRCNLVTIEDQTMKDFTADHISSEEAQVLLEAAQAEFGAEYLQFVPGVSYRNLLLWRGAQYPAPFSNETHATPPHDLTDKSVLNDYPRGPGSNRLTELMQGSLDLFANQPVNEKRVANGHLPATNVWLWGLGKQPALSPFAELYGLKGKMITAVDLLRGIAALIGWERIEVPGATGYTDTDYAAKGKAAIAALEENAVVCVHVEAPDEASHEGDLSAKLKALEEIDSKIVKPVSEHLQSVGEYRILVTPDHPTPLRTKTHSHGFVPLTIAGSGITADSFDAYHEVNAQASELAFDEGYKMMSYFVQS